ncbi:MAG: hypothetical protein Hyperionvirus18_2 [Hyperionvirus sp.]|uniref:Uncharacterized protein n=1 Tax=Hyperionvirus sp. TaxID=2487770 RepID=A0A3G5AA43_9VIRU|nr:MAG: hypothetical protein Hyperionvirus18_2 [Hyperionvirus sp.]
MASKKLYDNCEIYSPDKKLLGYCSLAKYDWYLTKNLAEKIEDGKVMLKFEPKYRTMTRDCASKKLNRCYVCSAEGDLRKYHVIPSQYKKQLPVTLKSHNSTDIIPLCVECESEATFEKEEFRRNLEDEYNVSQSNFIDDKKALLKALSKKILGARSHGILEKDSMVRIQEILKREPTDDDLKEYSGCNPSMMYQGTKSAAEYVTKQFLEKDQIKELMLLWKQLFVDTMDPEMIPDDFFFERDGLSTNFAAGTEDELANSK